MEKKILNTISELRKEGNVIELFTYYAKDFFLKAFIALKDLIENKVDVRQGQLGFTWNGYTDLDFRLNSEGELLIDSNDDKNFYIDDDGYLIMEEPE